MASTMTTATTEHTCHGAVFCGTPRARAAAECPACAAAAAADAQAQLRATTTSGLLTAAYALTHRMDFAERAAADASTPQVARLHRTTADDLRTQRDAITAEVIRRAGE